MTPRWLTVFRSASVVVAPALAWSSAIHAQRGDDITAVVTYFLGPLWVAIATALSVRLVVGLLRSSGGRRDVPALDRLDVLTGPGSGALWVSALLVSSATRLGWASLSIIGVMGMAIVALAVAWTLFVASGDDPFRVASIARRFVPGTAIEGDPVVEEIRVSGARIPPGFRLFATGTIGPRWPTSRYAVDGAASDSEVVLESEVGPAVRGDHDAPPLEIWLGDVLGLCRSVRRRAGAASLTVLPRLRDVEGAPAVLDRGGHDLEPRPALELPTEGSQHLREYQPGDDARRIHWMRSLATRQVVVRLPDELPPNRPKVRLVLDTFLAPSRELTCTAHEELLDALVRVWLGAGRALADAGVAVTLTTAAPKGDDIATRSLRVTPRAHAAALRLGAEVRWQEDLGVEDLVAESTAATVIVSSRLQPDPPGAPHARWIVVPRALWARFDEPMLQSSPALLPHPIGSPDNRWTTRRRERERLRRARRDGAALVDHCADTRVRERSDAALVAAPAGRDRIRLEAL